MFLIQKDYHYHEGFFHLLTAVGHIKLPIFILELHGVYTPLEIISTLPSLFPINRDPSSSFILGFSNLHVQDF